MDCYKSRRDIFGVFPLKGKLINASKKKSKVLLNTEVQNLIKILGLKIGREYESVQELRYGHVMIMADSDVDGSHIKGLVIFLFQTLWPSLLRISGFMQQFITPIIRVSKGQTTIDFFTMKCFEDWKRGVEGEVYKVKYYKGLGTSTSKDARVYFSDLGKHRLNFAKSTPDDVERLEMAFGKDANRRRIWINNYIKTDFTSDIKLGTDIWYKDFVNSDLVRYAWDSILRAIPSVIDGFKPGQRKVIYSMLNISDKERKVSQLMGIVSERTHYHHGEASLGQTIIRMAQIFTGKNNLNLLKPNGQFGTRTSGGDDCADPRYIFTELSTVTKSILKSEDNMLLERVIEDGCESEYMNFIPIIPLVLLNGSQGIAMGWRSFIPPHDIHQLVESIRDMLEGKQCPELHVHYKGYKGTVTSLQNGKVRVDGVVKVTGANELTITELPIGFWTQDYVQFIETLIKRGDVTNYQQFHTEHTVKFIISTSEVVMDIDNENLIDIFKLRKEYSASLVLFDTDGKLKSYNSTKQIFSDFFHTRLGLYEQRRCKLIELLEKEVVDKDNVIRFIEDVNNGRIDVRKTEVEQIEELMVEKGYKNIDSLLDLSIKCMTMDRLLRLKRERENRYNKLLEFQNITSSDLWRRDLVQFENELSKWEKMWDKERLEDLNAGKAQSNGHKRKKVNNDKKDRTKVMKK